MLSLLYAEKCMSCFFISFLGRCCNFLWVCGNYSQFLSQLFSAFLQKSGCFHYLTQNSVAIVVIIFSFSVYTTEQSFPDDFIRVQDKRSKCY